MALASTLCRGVLAIVFTFAGAAKLRSLPSVRETLRTFGVPEGMVAPAAVLLPLVEIVLALGLLRVVWVRLAAIGIAVLLSAFSAAIAWSLLHGRAPRCSCFGRIRSARVSWTSIARNCGLTIAAAVAATNSHRGTLAWTRIPDRTLSVMGALALLLVILLVPTMAYAVMRLLEQHGRALVRLDRVEKAARGAGDWVSAEAPLLGQPVPAAWATAGDGQLVDVRARVTEGDQRVLLLFLSAECGACDALLPELVRWQSTHDHQLTLVPIDLSASNSKGLLPATFGILHTLRPLDIGTSRAFGVTATPSAVLVDSGIIASPLASGVQEIHALVELAVSGRARRPQANADARLAFSLEGQASEGSVSQS